MKQIFFIILVIWFYNVKSQTNKKVLFLGNSYTYVNDLPLIIDSLANAEGNDLIYDQNTPSGYTLEEHSTNSTSLAKIASQNWDFVVIQEQSQRPAFSPSQVTTEVYPYAEILNDSVISNDSCSETLFFMTWGRQNGDQTNCQYYPPICTYEGMQQGLRNSYLEMGINNNASVSPVGMAWKKVRELTNDTINLYSSDESHPSIYGSYLAACVFYASIFDKSPIGNSYHFNLPNQTALFLQTIANDVVFDSTYVWNFQKAKFGYKLINNNTFLFTGTKNTLSDYWDFGDGTNSTTHDPTHTFPGSGNYQVKHIIQNNCITDTIITQIYSSVTGLNNNNLNNFAIYPNPANIYVQIKSNLKVKSIGIYDIYGRNIKILSGFKCISGLINIKFLPKGIYFIKLKTNQGILVKKFIKQ